MTHSFTTHSLIGTNNQFCYVSPLTSLHGGYSSPEAMLGTTVFDIKTPVIEISDVMNTLNQRVMQTKKCSVCLISVIMAMA
ncbi:MAG: hypothetical protein COB66_07385 [Coxiella sp. (in: Bacteria)]|nr:MAG: hypothetical protein COB66_07385 [Coxiella sp. (in: g-proteobacteria)]